MHANKALLPRNIRPMNLVHSSQQRYEKCRSRSVGTEKVTGLRVGLGLFKDVYSPTGTLRMAIAFHDQFTSRVPILQVWTVLLFPIPCFSSFSFLSSWCRRRSFVILSSFFYILFVFYRLSSLTCESKNSHKEKDVLLAPTKYIPPPLWIEIFSTK